MAEAAARPATASVASFRIADFAGRPVAEQLALRERLDAALAGALAPVAAAGRVVLDAADGAIVVFLDSAEAALRAADAARAAALAAAVPLRIGLNAGPVAVAPGFAGEPTVVGDGVAAAAVVAGFAHRGTVTASRSFRELLARENPDLKPALRRAGERTDERLRTHEVFTCGAVPRDPGRRRMLRTAGIAIGAILVAGLSVRAARHLVAARSKPAVVALEITPWAEVVVDGASRGRTPPAKSLELPPGNHTIEIRHPGARPIVVEVDLKAGEETTIRHAFATAPPPASPVRNFLRKFGL